MTANRLLTYLITLVWLANGLICKALDLVPRHRQIVARIIGGTHARAWTLAIGMAEIAMAVWIISGFRPRLNAVTQSLIIATMNTIEFILAPDLLLWGRFNALFAFLFILLILYNGFYLNNRQTRPQTLPQQPTNPPPTNQQALPQITNKPSWHNMLSFLKNHPFAVEAFFESSLVFTFAIPKAQLQPLIPDCLHLDTFNDRWAFIAVAMVQTKSLRPKGFPRFLGHDFFLIGYRVFVRFTNKAGKNLRGLYILKSETDKRKMEFFGNIFTHYNYSTTDIHQVIKDGTTGISSKTSDFHVLVDSTGKEDIPLPPESPFADWKEARRFAGPLPFTFTCNAATKEVLVIEGVRENWKPAPVRVIHQKFSFIDSLGLTDVRLANAFIIRDIPYYWKKGKIEPWSQKEENFRAH